MFSLVLINSTTFKTVLVVLVGTLHAELAAKIRHSSLVKMSQSWARSHFSNLSFTFPYRRNILYVIKDKIIKILNKLNKRSKFLRNPSLVLEKELGQES